MFVCFGNKTGFPFVLQSFFLLQRRNLNDDGAIGNQQQQTKSKIPNQTFKQCKRSIHWASMCVCVCVFVCF